MTISVHHIADVMIEATAGEIVAATCGAALCIVAAASLLLCIARVIQSLRKPKP